MTTLSKILFVLFYFIMPAAAGFTVLYYVVKAAVKNGIKESRSEEDSTDS